MAHNFGLLNLGNVSKSFRDKEIICSRQLVKKCSSLKKRGARLLHSVKYKFDGEFSEEKESIENERTNLENVDHPIDRPKRCLCDKPKSQFKKCVDSSRWRSRINDIGSITRLALRKKRVSSITKIPDIESVKNLTKTINPRTENETAMKEFNFSSDPERNSEILSRISKDREIQSKLSSFQADKELNFSNDTERNSESLLSRTSKDIQKQSRLSSLQGKNSGVAGTEQFNLLNDPDRISERLSGISKISGIFAEPAKPETDATSRLPERRQSLEEDRKSSIKSQRTSLPLPVEPMEPIAEIETNIVLPKIQEINDEQIESLDAIEERKELERESIIPPIVNFEAVIEKEKPVEFEIINISRKEFDSIARDKDVRKIVKIDHKNLLPDMQTYDPDEEWKGTPAPVMDEIRRITKPKRSHKCSRACPCKFSQELINIYHEAKFLSEKANKIGDDRKHCKFRMTSSEIDFFKEDTKMCNVMIGETQSRRAEMRELMDMWQEVNEKLTVRKREIIAIVDSVDRTRKRMDEVEDLLKDWLPGGRMENFRKAQRAIEKKEQEKMDMLEDEERTLCKKKIEEIVGKREAWLADEELREEKRKIQRQKDSLSLESAINLMQNYIDERKTLLNRKILTGH